MLALITILSGLAWLAMNNPLGNNWVPRCPTEQFMGFYCPGCGSTRATHHLLNARLMSALAYNPALVVVGLPLGLWYLARTTAFILFGRRVKFPMIPAKAGWAALILLLAFTALRNLPFTWADHLRPTAVNEDRTQFQKQLDQTP